jgi:copper resistance protein B
MTAMAARRATPRPRALAAAAAALLCAPLARPLGAQPEHEHAVQGAREQTTEPVPSEAHDDHGADTQGHLMLEDPLNRLVRVDRLEAGDGGDAAWDVDAWVGHDLSKLWLRSQGERDDDTTASAEIDVLWARSFSRWWDFVAGARHDFRPDSDETWAVLGVQGLAPYRFDVEATAFVADGGRVSARVEAQYDLLITNRLVLQPLLEADWHSQSDAERGVGPGLSSAELGLRLRYEVRREIAPYVGLVLQKKLGGTADRARANGVDTHDMQLVAGVRIWF